MRDTPAVIVSPAADERAVNAARELIRAHFEAHSDAHSTDEIDAMINRLPAPYVPPRGGLWVAWLGETAVGCVALQPLSEDAGEVKRMYVRPENRGLGIARRLSARVISEARARGYKVLRLGTLATMEPAQNLYTSLGFRPIEPYRPIEFGTTLFYELELSR